MTRPALVHVYPQWEPPESDPTADPDDYVEVMHGRMRIVRNRRRARLLKRRGVPMWDSREAPGRAWLWFTEITA